jgi:thioredoxin-related protein
MPSTTRPDSLPDSLPANPTGTARSRAGREPRPARTTAAAWVGWVAAAVAALSPMLTPARAAAAPEAMTKKPAAGAAVANKPANWTDRFYQAQKRAQKEEKPMLFYFCSSDRDDFTKQLDEEVLSTPLWTEWANQSLVLLKVDAILDEKKQSAEIRNQNRDLRTRFGISKVPTFIFVDPWGDLLARKGYDTAKLRDDEPKGQPAAWLAYCKEVVASRPAKEKLVGYPDLAAGVTAVRKTAIPLCILITQGTANKVAVGWTETLLQNQLFVRFVNRNMGFVHVDWPEETDVSAKAKYVRDFGAKWKFGASAFQLVVWSPGGVGEVKGLIGGFDPVDCGPLIKRLEPMLPAIDYGGGWLEDWKVAKALAAQQQKDLFVSFVCTDQSAYTKKMYDEIYETPEFKDYAKKSLILMKVDFPVDPANAAKQTKELKEQNTVLADMFGIRGYPQVVIVNPKGQKILDAKYMKGGASVFVAEMKKQITKDKDRRTILSKELSNDVEKSR